MNDTDNVCLCFHVSHGKIRRFLQREQPQVVSKLSECLDAGTGCGWCRPFLKQMYQQWADGQPVQLTVNPASYATGRDRYKDRGTPEGSSADT